MMFRTLITLSSWLCHIGPKIVYGAGVLLLLSACASVGIDLENKTFNLETSIGYITNGKEVKILFDSIDGRQSGLGSEYVTPGLHKIVTKVEWSNGYVEKVEFAIDIEPEAKYFFGAFELKPGQNQADAMLRPKTFAEELVEAGYEGDAAGFFVGGGWIVVLPIWLFSNHEHVKNRPFEHCCFIWVEDVTNHRIIEGIRPSGITMRGVENH